MKKIVVLLCILSMAAFAKSNIGVNWGAGIITSSSQASFKTNSEGMPIDSIDSNRTTISGGRNAAYSQARVTALENMSNIIMNIRVDGSTIIKDLIESDNEFNRQLSYILDSKVKEKTYPIDFFTSKSELSLSLGEIINILPYRFPNDEFPTFAYVPISTRYTSLIVDTRGQQIMPTILPSIFGKDGLEVYGRYFINIRYAMKNGLVSYVFDEKEAFRHQKAGKNPYFATSMRNINNNPVLNNEDVKRLYSSPKTLVELKKCKVIFIIDGGK